MGLTSGILRNYLELCLNKNEDLLFGIDDVRGVNNQKQLMSTKANLMGRDLRKFQIVYPGDFVFNHRTSRNGSKFSIAYNDGKKPVICTEDYVVFRVRDDCKEILNARWLYMFFNRPEFDRYVITNSWGSSTEFYNWEDIKAIKVNIPDIAIQRKYVDIYNTMLENQKCYEVGLEDLKTACIGKIENLKKTYSKESILPYLIQRQELNNEMNFNELVGVGGEGFITPRGSRAEDTFYKCNIFYPRDFVYNPSVISKGAIAFNNKYNSPKICTEEYIVFYVKNESKLLPEYLFLWLRREDTGRFLDFYYMDSVRNRVYFDYLEAVKIPIPDFSIQKSIADLYTAYYARKEINEKLKKQIKDICPILIKGSIEEGRKTKEA